MPVFCFVFVDARDARVPRQAVMRRVVAEERAGAAGCGASATAAVTILEVCHDLRGLDGCDEVAVVAAGRVAEVGPPAQLRALRGGQLAALLAAAREEEPGAQGPGGRAV
jgi:hypothetical protein